MNQQSISESFETAYNQRRSLVNEAVAAFVNYLRTTQTIDNMHVREALESYISVLQRGGKRTRGVLTLMAYEMCDGDNPKIAHAAAGAMEALHAYLLVVDDIADDSSLRRGAPTAHIALQQYLQGKHMGANGSRLAENIVQMTALAAQHAAQAFLLEALQSTDQSVLRATMLLINKRLAQTGEGQILDLLLANSQKVTNDEILTVAQTKTAYYSFLLPLELGATLANASTADIQSFQPFAKAAGIAFQLRDDVIGLFGDEQQSGKPRQSDIVEGKKTLLIQEALQRTNPDQQVVLHAALGNKNLTDEEFEKCLDIIQSCGALDEIKRQTAALSTQALALLKKLPAHWSDYHMRFLHDLVIFTSNRPT